MRRWLTLSFLLSFAVGVILAARPTSSSFAASVTVTGQGLVPALAATPSALSSLACPRSGAQAYVTSTTSTWSCTTTCPASCDGTTSCVYAGGQDAGQLGCWVNGSAPTPRRYYLFVGDSITKGSVTGTASGVPATIRMSFARALDAAGIDTMSVGPYLDAPVTVNASSLAVTGGTPNRFQGSGTGVAHAAVLGQTITQINSRIGAQIAALKVVPDAVLLMAGTNDIVLGGTSAAALAAMTTLHTTIRSSLVSLAMSLGRPASAGNASWILVGSIPPAYQPYTSIAAAYNAGLPALVAGWGDANAMFVDTCPASYSQALQGYTSAPITTDVHPSLWGAQQIGANWYAAFRKLFPAATAQPWPRPLTPRPSQNSVVLADVAGNDAVVINNPNLLPGTSSWAVAFNYYPTELTAGSALAVASLLQDYDVGVNGAPGWTLMNFASSNTTYGALGMYSVSGAPIGSANNSIQINTWHRVAVVGHAGDGVISVWVNGYLAFAAQGQSWNFNGLGASNYVWNFGGKASGGVGQTMYVDNVEFSIGASVPSFFSGDLAAAVRAQYAEQIPIPGLVSSYRMAEGSGTALYDRNVVDLTHGDSAPSSWATSTSYATGARVKNGTAPSASVYEQTGSSCTSAGSSGGPSGSGSAITDNNCTWRYHSAIGAIGAAGAGGFWTLTVGGGTAGWGTPGAHPGDW